LHSRSLLSAEIFVTLEPNRTRPRTAADANAICRNLTHEHPMPTNRYLRYRCLNQAGQNVSAGRTNNQRVTKEKTAKQNMP
jgi:hypothetical protein